ncbi:MAG: FecR domain-containing protein [Bryobacteraceae bacterium]
MSGYLWDKSGEPDAGIEGLEKLLSPLGHRSERIFVLPRRTRWIPIAMAASLLIIVGASWLAVHRNRAAWQVSGDARVTRLARGQSLRTDASSHAKLELESVGEVEIEPNSQVSVMTLGSAEQRLDLKRGKISALIWAPPGQFFVNTPSVVTVDLGCAYTLEVDASGASLVKVTAGWVAFEGKGDESFIPATAACLTRPGNGPGIPYYEDASDALKSAVDQGAVPQILTEVRPRDAITVWHLLRRVPVDQRGPVFDRLAKLIAIPSGVTREGVAAGNSVMIDALWDSLDLGDTSWWRSWKTKMR